MADVVIVRDDMAPEDYYVVDGSREASSWMLGSATKAIERGRYRVDFTLAPFVGGFLGGDEVLDVALDIGGLTRGQSPPFFISSAIVNDAGYADALAAVLKQVASTDVQGMGPLVTYADSAVPARPDWSLLSERMGTDYLLVAVTMACDRLLRCGNDPHFYRLIRDDEWVLKYDPVDDSRDDCE